MSESVGGCKRRVHDLQERELLRCAFRPYALQPAPDAKCTTRTLTQGRGRLRQTDGVAPREAACDAVFRVVRAAGQSDPIIFNCQMGAGRTTTGMVIACLTRTFTTGALPRPMHASTLCGLLAGQPSATCGAPCDAALTS